MRTLKPCGTRAAYQRHLYRGEVPCDACTEANTQSNWKYRGRSPRVAARCGTVAGQRRHVQRGEPVCDRCRASHAARMRQWRRGKRIRPRISDSIIDVLSTEARWLTVDTIADRILEIHPEWKPESVQRVLHRVVDEGLVERRVDPDCPRGVRFQFFCDEWAVA